MIKNSRQKWWSFIELLNSLKNPRSIWIVVIARLTINNWKLKKTNAIINISSLKVNHG